MVDCQEREEVSFMEEISEIEKGAKLWVEFLNSPIGGDKEQWDAWIDWKYANLQYSREAKHLGREKWLATQVSRGRK